MLLLLLLEPLDISRNVCLNRLQAVHKTNSFSVRVCKIFYHSGMTHVLTL